MISASDDLPERAFTDELAHFKSVANLVTIDDSVVAFSIVKAVVYQSFLLGGLVLLIWPGKVPNFFIFLNFGLLMVIQEVFGAAGAQEGFTRDWEVELQLRGPLLDGGLPHD